MPGARCTHGLVCELQKAHELKSPQAHRTHPAFPHALVYGLYAISPVSMTS
jgi:hypothetical protein